MTTDIETSIRSRLGELNAERERLERALAALVADVAQNVSTRAARRAGGTARKTAPRAKSRARARKRAPRGQNREAILGVLDKKPGLKAADVARETGIAAPTVYTTISKLKKAGVLKADKDGALQVAKSK
jgi:DNA-binding transcriptional ArsR family regulator